jgi:hypothetical protein
MDVPLLREPPKDEPPLYPEDGAGREELYRGEE